MRALAVGAGWLFSPWGRAFRAALADPVPAQERLRRRLLAGARRTVYGADFRRWEDVPVVDWDQLGPWVERQRAGEPRALVPDPVRFYEATSGSTGRAKSIPYSAALLRCFTRMFGLWAHDVLTNGPRLRTLSLYFSVSPRLGDAPTPGTTDDRDFLTGWAGALVRPFWRSPPGLAAERDPEAYWRRLATFLAAEERLEVISVWSPSFLHVLFGWMTAHRDELPRGDRVGDWTRLWPELKLVSCWASGSSARGAAGLAAALPGVLVQGKGLLATEAPVTIPLVGVGPVPLVDTVGIELEAEGRVMGVEAADVGGTYGVVVSQPAGLLRYRLGDQVRVTGHLGRTPILELIGRPTVSDLVGEKLTEAAVSEAFAAAGVPSERWAVLVPAEDHYRLVVDAAVDPRLGARVDAALRGGVHYDHARALGQLGPVRVLVVPDAPRRELASGPVWGGTKPRLLRAGLPGGDPWTL